MRKIGFTLALFMLAACQNHSSQPPQSTPQKLDKTVVQKGSTVEYLCKNDLVVRVEQTRTMQKNKRKLPSISVTFNSVTRKLQPTISEMGKNYVGIHWMWQERENFSSLKTSTGVILAEQCVPKI